MPYAQYTLAGLTTLILGELGDPAGIYWTSQEVTYALNEALREYSLTTAFWRANANYTIPAATLDSSTQWTDLSVALPNLRTRKITTQQIVNEILLHFSEPPAYGGGSAYNITAQFTYLQIVNAIDTAYNQTVYDIGAPLSVQTQPYTVDNLDQVQLSFQTSRIERLSWLDAVYPTWTRLYESTLYAVDAVKPNWYNLPGQPRLYSQVENTPQLVQLIPTPSNAGTLELIAVPQGNPDPDAGKSMNIPDDWAHAVKYYAMSVLLTSDGENTSGFLAQFCMIRYRQIIEAAKLQRTLIRMQVNGQQINIVGIQGLDMTIPNWRNKYGNKVLSVMPIFDLVTFYPLPRASFSGTFTVVQSAPQLAAQSDYVQLGYEDVQAICSYAQNYLSIKCQGLELQQTLPLLDQFNSTVLSRNSLLNAQSRYMQSQFNRRQYDLVINPDRVVTTPDSNSDQTTLPTTGNLT